MWPIPATEKREKWHYAIKAMVKCMIALYWQQAITQNNHGIRLPNENSM